MKNSNIYAGYRYPAQIISHAVWLYHRFTLSFRDIEISRNYSHRGQLGDTWYLDEVFVKINGV